MKPNPVAQTWRAHLTVALLTGLVLGACVGLFEGFSVLLSQDLLGRYNELVAWAIAFDTSAIVAAEIALAVMNAIIFMVMSFESVPYHLVALQLAESVFVGTTAFGLWTQGMADPHLLATSPLSVIGPPGLVGILLGELVLVISKSILDWMPRLRHLTPRYWLIAGGLVVLGAVAFSFAH